jgi:hypothetical protein
MKTSSTQFPSTNSLSQFHCTTGISLSELSTQLWSSSLNWTAKVRVKSHVTTDGQSASLSCNKASIWGLSPVLYYCQTVVDLLMRWCGALSLTRGRVCRLLESQLAVISLLSVCPIYIFNVIKYMYVCTTCTRPLSAQAQYSRSWPIISRSCYNSSLVTWTVVCLTAPKFKPLIFPVSGFVFSNVANVCIFMILDDFCLLPA